MTPGKDYGLSAKEVEFLKHSNYIEGEYSEEALEDAIKAWVYLKDKQVMTPQVIRHTHKILMKRLRPDIAGMWRRCDVMIGGQIKKFVSWQEFNKQLNKWCRIVLLSIHSGGEKWPRNKCAKLNHIAFEDHHPFEDGNGRVGRMLYQWHRLQMGLKIKVIHEGEEQRAYYRWFR